ncbi:MAG: hypothetical protein IKN55_08915 [Oscillospiraceae bacterium]|nr:hypothetical protein [Oscillospiraceae bacterium]
MKKYRRFAAIFASIAVFASVAALPMSAGAAGTQYTPGLTAATDGTNKVSQNVTMIDKYLVMDVNANVPNASFDFSIAPYDSESDEKAVITAASGTNLAVINGVTALTDGTLDFKANDAANTGSATAGVVSFVQSDTNTTVTEGATGADEAVVWQDNTSGNEKYAKKTLTLDFSTVQFTEPGVYRYLITETGTNQGITNDTGVTGDGQNTYRTLDVYVEDYAGYLAALEAAEAGSTDGYTPVNGKELLITGYVLYEGKHDAAPSATAAEATGKSSSYTNAYASYDLSFSKTVTGNQGSKDKYFAFTVQISNAVAGTVFDVSYSDDSNDNTTDGNADVNIAANPNSATTCITTAVTQPAKLTVGADGTVSQVFYLQHGQSIAIRGLAEGTSYSITEAPEDYSDTATVTGDTKTQDKTKTGGTEAEPVYGSDISYSNHQIADTYISGDAEVAFTNDRSGTIPTGILTTVAGSLGIVVLGAAGVIGGALYMRKKKSEEE